MAAKMSAFPTTEMSANTLFIADKIAISALFSAPEQSSSRVEFCVLVVFIPGGLERTNDRFSTARCQFFLLSTRKWFREKTWTQMTSMRRKTGFYFES